MKEHSNSPKSNKNYKYCFFSKQYYFLVDKFNDNNLFDLPQNKKTIQQICHYFGEQHISLLNQVHSNRVKFIQDISDINEPSDQFDSQITNNNGIILGLLTADCAPILVADNEKGIIAAIHAGWRGALNGVIENTLTRMQELGSDYNNLECFIGPTIGWDSYEVDGEFRDKFINSGDNAAEFFRASSTKSGKYYFNLPGYISEKLLANGVRNIYNEAVDTYVNSHLYPSHRRKTHEEIKTGEEAGNLQSRFLSAICLV